MGASSEQVAASRERHWPPFIVAPSLLLAACCSLGVAQGLLPPQASTATEVVASRAPIQIGAPVPDSLTVTGADGKRLPISTYKGPLDDLVVVFLSARCPTDQEAWPALRRLYEDYKDWNVTFLGVSQDSPQSLQEVQQAAAKAGLPTGQAGAGFPIVRDESGKVTRALGVQATPEALILDEWSYLRYRGALDRGLDTPGRRPKARLVRRALNTLIGHSEAVKTPQPDDYIGCPIQ